ncbi:hypothetical protein DFQ28_003321 [Apophysomyces sp. BC1034]|nr:hypothetical protein DFQ28_003321 [Apophysomyces sp. BC1034]
MASKTLMWTSSHSGASLSATTMMMTKLKKIYGQTVPSMAFCGVSGCGKTRTATEMLSKNWGFYFNASGTDLGSNDLYCLLKMAQERRRYRHGHTASSTHVHILAQVLVLTRLIVLQHCLKIVEREGKAFTCKDWMLLKVGFHTMGVMDLFAGLFSLIADEIHRHSIDFQIMESFVRERSSGLHQLLPSSTPNSSFQRSDYKILLMIGEAQNLSKQDYGTFPSKQAPSEAERQARANEFCVLPCETGLSILDSKWLEDSAPAAKGYARQLEPSTDFQGWESLEQIQTYRNLVRRSLPNNKAKCPIRPYVSGTTR